MTKCHFCGKSAPVGQYVRELSPVDLPACNKCLHDWIHDPEKIWDKLSAMCRGLGRDKI